MLRFEGSNITSCHERKAFGSAGGGKGVVGWRTVGSARGPRCETDRYSSGDAWLGAVEQRPRNTTPGQLAWLPNGAVTVEGKKIVSRGSYGKDYIPNQQFSLRSETKGVVRVLEILWADICKGVWKETRLQFVCSSVDCINTILQNCSSSTEVEDTVFPWLAILLFPLLLVVYAF